MAATRSPRSERDALARHLAAATGARAATLDLVEPLSGGAVQESWRLQARFDGGALAGVQRLVLRSDAATALGIGLDREGEFQVLRAVHAAGIAAPEPLLLCEDPAIIGKPFFLMRELPGDAAPGPIVAGARGGEPAALAASLARTLAAIHAIRPPRAELAGLGAAPADAAAARIEAGALLLASDPAPHPVAEWGLRWLRRNAPMPAPPVLCHGDFRTGNFLVDEQGLTGILDWEFAHWGDGDEDLGWFCLGCWRFGAYAREAGGIARREDFLAAYERAAGRAVERERLRWWEVMAALTWLVIALRQRDRCLLGGENSLDLALTGRRPAECELEILKLTEAA